jgi:hypothetical protein
MLLKETANPAWRAKFPPCVIDRNTADRIVRAFRAMLVPRRIPGRKPCREVLAAEKLKERGWSWPLIYPEVFADWARWSWDKQSNKTFVLRKAVRTRRRLSPR